MSPKFWKDTIEFEISQDADFMMIWTSLLPDLEAKNARALVEMVAARYPFSPNYDHLFQICPEVVFCNMTDEWVFFGGTFDPWHAGHQACLNLIPKDKTCLIIPDRSPHKDIREINTVSTVLELSSRIKFGKEQYLVPTFLMEKKTNPTVEWIEIMRKHLPQCKLSLLLGYDSFDKILSWTRGQDLLRTLNCLYVVSRMEKDLDRMDMLTRVKKEAPELEINFLGHHQFENISSTNLRVKASL